jgi:hypothetical protein
MTSDKIGDLSFIGPYKMESMSQEEEESRKIKVLLTFLWGRGLI